MSKETRKVSAATLPAAEPDGEFRDFNCWVHHATSWIGGRNALCADAQGRICSMGMHFMRARDENTFPVRFWYGEGGKSARDQAKDRAATRRMLGNFKFRLRESFG